MATSQEDLASVPKYKLMMVGKTGAGKSSFGNFVLGRKSFKASSGLEVVTAKAAADSVTMEGFELYVVDTPGFGDPNLSEDEDELGLTEIARGLQLAVEDGDAGVDMIVYVISAAERFTSLQRSAIEAIQEGNFWSYVLVVFTNGDKIAENDKRQHILDLLSREKCPKALKQTIEDVKGRFMIVDSNNPSEAYRNEQVRALLHELHCMKKRNEGKRYSNKLFQIIHERYQLLKEESKNHAQAISQLKEDAKKAKEDNEKALDTMNDKIQELNKQLEESEEKGKEVKSLREELTEMEEKRSSQKEESEAAVKLLQQKVEKLEQDRNTAAIEKKNLENNVKSLKQELQARPHENNGGKKGSSCLLL